MAILRFIQPLNERDIIPEVSRCPEPYAFTAADDEDVIFAATTYYRPKLIYKACLDPKLSVPVKSSLASPFLRNPYTNLGHLSILPLEILSHILLLLPIPSLLTFRNTNQRARIITSSLPEYRLITNHALSTLQALLHTQVAQHLTLASLSHLLRQNNCHTCGNYGMYLYLPLLQRTCNRCYNMDDSFKILPITSHQTSYLPDDIIKAKIVGKLYLPDEENHLNKYYQYIIYPGPFEHPEPIYLVSTVLYPDFQSKYRLGDPYHLRDESTQKSQGILEFPHLEVLDGGEVRVDGPRNCFGCIKGFGELFKRGDRGAGAGLPSGFDQAYNLMMRFYGRETYWEHFRWCADAQGRWKQVRGW